MFNTRDPDSFFRNYNNLGTDSGNPCSMDFTTGSWELTENFFEMLSLCQYNELNNTFVHSCSMKADITSENE